MNENQTTNYLMNSRGLPLTIWNLEIDRLKQKSNIPKAGLFVLIRKKIEAFISMVRSCAGKYLQRDPSLRIVEELKRKNADLELLNRELEAFSYSISHDLKAPLRAIYSYGKMLAEDCMDPLSEEGNKVIQLILQNSKRMEQLINDLLTFSKLGKKEIIRQDINMQALVKTVSDELLSLCDKNRIEITVHDIQPASGDQALVKQVWINLISNALKYSGKKEKSVIEIGSCSKGNENVYYVKDNGTGFDMKYYDKLFGVFQRLHSDNDFEGTGIGLATTRRIIQKHRGRIWAESKLNEGTVFYFSLPVVDGKTN